MSDLVGSASSCANRRQRSGKVGRFLLILTKACKDTIQSPLVDLGDNLAGGEGRIKTIYIRGESGNDTGRLKSRLEDPRAESEPIAPTVVVPERILVSPSFLCVQVIG